MNLDENLDENLKHCFEGVGTFYDGPWYPSVQQYLLDKLDIKSKKILLHYDIGPKDLWVIGQICIDAIEASDFNNNYAKIETDEDKLNDFIHKFYENNEAIKLYYENVPSRVAAL